MDHPAPESSTRPSRAPLDKATLRGLAPERVLHGRNLSKADVSLYRYRGAGIAVKDYGPRPFLARHTIGRLLVRRECKAYASAGAIPGVAVFLGRLGPYTFATGWVDGSPLAELPRGGLVGSIFDRLDQVLAALHARGVALSDLHHRDVIVGDDGTVHVVDFATAYVLPARPGPLARRLFAHTCSLDRLAAARMRARFTGAPEDGALAASDATAVRLWGVGRRLKAVWDRARGRSR